MAKKSTTTRRANNMGAREYLQALQKLGLTPYSASKVLGVSLSTSHRIARGEQALPRTVALLLACYLTHGLPSEN